MFQQDIKNQPVRDFVFPIGNVVASRFELQGTAFFIGGDGFALGAAHVANALSGDAVGLFADKNGRWVPIKVEQKETHATEDVAAFKLAGRWHSICELSCSREFASCDYELWTYPELVAQELRAMAKTKEEYDLVRPDLIYNRGYVRRRIAQELPASVFRGKSFYELSEAAGSCSSGAPVIKKKREAGAWPVFGVYIGEETSSHRVGYAVTADCLADWKPRILGVRAAEVKATVS